MSLEVVDGDLLDQPVDAIVNGWNRNVIPWWLLPQGLAGDIKRRAGTQPFEELGYEPLPLGGARHTGAGKLPHRGIIHVAAIDLLWRATAESIARSTRTACELAMQRGYRSLALPVLGSGSGAGGFDFEHALQVMRVAAQQYFSVLSLSIVRCQAN